MSDAGDLLKRMADAYAGVRTYADRSLVVETSRSDHERCERREDTRLHFERPGRLRFEDRESVVWAEGRRARYLLRGRFESDTLPMAIMSVMMRGTRRWTAFGAAGLLLPGEVPGPALHRLERPVLQGEAPVDGVPCRRLAGRQDDVEVTLWIDAEALLVRRILERRRIGPAKWLLEAEKVAAHLHAIPSIPEHLARVPVPARPPERLEIETTTHVEPVADRPIDPALFKPRRPGSGSR